MSSETSRPAAASVTRQLDHVVFSAAQDSAFLLRRALLLVNAAGFLSGYFVMFDEWMQLGWLGVMTGMWLWAGGANEFTEGLRKDIWMTLVCTLGFLLMARSSMLHSPGMTVTDLWAGWARSMLLLPVLMMLWQAARTPGVMRRVGLPMAAMAVVAALTSALVFYHLDPASMFGTRLKNWFIYGGWNSVCTGLTFGFAAVWAAACWNSAKSRWERHLWFVALVPLIAATLFTLSRGALFALAMAHVALVAICGWKRAWRPVTVFLVMAALFQICGPLLSSVAVRDAALQFGVEDHALAAELVGDAVVSANPVGAMVERADNGRFSIFQAGLGSMTTWQDWVMGKGLWASNDSWSCSLHWYPEHLHSVFLDALVRGGLIGLLGLLGLVAWGGWRAVVLAKRGEELWLMLATFGVVGLLFDGDSAFALLTVPRYEPLLLWAPLVMASARYHGIRQQELAAA